MNAAHNPIEAWLLPSVHEVAQKQVLVFFEIAADLNHIYQVIELAVNVAHDSHRIAEIQQIALVF